MELNGYMMARKKYLAKVNVYTSIQDRVIRLITLKKSDGTRCMLVSELEYLPDDQYQKYIEAVTLYSKNMGYNAEAGKTIYAEEAIDYERLKARIIGEILNRCDPKERSRLSTLLYSENADDVLTILSKVGGK